jgi:hypothetical protein
VRLAQLIEGNELKVNAVVWQQTKAAVTRILDSDGSFRSRIHLQAEDGWIADLRQESRPIRDGGSPCVKYSSQTGPDFGHPLAPRQAAEMGKKASQTIDGAGQASDRHSGASLGEIE